jgi:hypothetical protein
VFIYYIILICEWFGDKIMRIEKLPNRSAGFFSIVALGLVVTLMVGVPVENIPAEQIENATVIEVPAITNLRGPEPGLNSITWEWSKPSDSADIAIFKIYLDEILIDTLDGSSHTYTVTRLRPGTWYNFHVDACNTSGICSIGSPRAGASTLTIQTATEAIRSKVEEMTSSGVLNTTQGESLNRNLAVIYQLDNTNAKTTITQLQFFIDNINSLITDGVLSQESGQTLIDDTDDVIRNLL